jgi:hypothetical protein
MFSHDERWTFDAEDARVLEQKFQAALVPIFEQIRDDSRIDTYFNFMADDVEWPIVKSIRSSFCFRHRRGSPQFREVTGSDAHAGTNSHA